MGREEGGSTLAPLSICFFLLPPSLPYADWARQERGMNDIFHVQENMFYISLLNWTETKRVKQLIIHGAIISSINMVITGISRGMSQLQIPPRREKDPPKRDCNHSQELSSLFFEIL